MMQGDACNLGFRLENNAGSPITPEDVSQVEIILGHLCKSTARAELFYYDGLGYFPLSQSESRSLWPSAVDAQIRVAWINGVVEGKNFHGIRVEEALSREVL